MKRINPPWREYVSRDVSDEKIETKKPESLDGARSGRSAQALKRRRVEKEEVPCVPNRGLGGTNRIKIRTQIGAMSEVALMMKVLGRFVGLAGR